MTVSVIGACGASGTVPAGEEPSMSTRITTVLVVLHDDGRALIRLLALCHRRGWTPASLRSVSDGDRCEVTMRLRVPADRRGTHGQGRTQLGRLRRRGHGARRGTDGQVRTQLGRLVGVERVAIDRGPARRQRFPASTVLRATQPD